MPEQELAVRQRTLAERAFELDQRLAKAYAESGYFTDARTIAQTLVKIDLARELEVARFEAMTDVHVIEGKPELGAGILSRLVKRSGRYDYRVRELTNDCCSIAFLEAASGELLGVSTFTVEDATRAGLVGRGPWQKYPRNMLFARAISNGVAWFCPDAVRVRVYVDGEIGPDVDPQPVYLEADAVEVAEPEPEPDAPELADLVAKAIEAYDATDTVPATEAQRKRMHALFRKRGADRAQRLASCSEVAGREIRSSTDLTRDEVSKIIDQLEAMPPPAAEPEPERPPIAETKLLALDSLVGNTVEERAITVRDLWAEVAGYRRVRPLDLIVELDGQDGAGRVKWPPLREALRPDEVGDLTRYVEQIRQEAGLPDDIPF